MPNQHSSLNDFFDPLSQYETIFKKNGCNSHGSTANDPANLYIHSGVHHCGESSWDKRERHFAIAAELTSDLYRKPYAPAAAAAMCPATDSRPFWPQSSLGAVTVAQICVEKPTAPGQTRIASASATIWSRKNRSSHWQKMEQGKYS